MAGALRHFTLQSMVQTNHKFPVMGPPIFVMPKTTDSCMEESFENSVFYILQLHINCSCCHLGRRRHRGRTDTRRLTHTNGKHRAGATDSEVASEKE